MVRTDGLSQLRTDDHSGSLSCRTTSEEHNTGSSVLERSLHKTDCNTQGHTSAAHATVVAGSGPWILLKSLQSLGELELGTLDGEKESSSRGSGHLSAGLGLHARSKSRGESQHFLNLLGRVVLVASEDVGLSAALIADLVYLGLISYVSRRTHTSIHHLSLP